MTSINTNIAATTALRTLQQTNAQLDQTQGRISTGLKIGSAKDNAAYWSISTALQSDNKAIAAVKDALNLGAGAVDVAYQGLTKAKDVLDDFQQKLTSALSPNADRRAVQDDIASYQEALRTIAGNSFFSGENWLTTDTETGGSERKVVASFSRDANNQVTIGTLDVDLTRIALFDGAEGGILGKQVDLTTGGQDLNFGGFGGVGTATSVAGITPTNTGAQILVPARAAVAELGTFNAASIDTTDRLRFDLSVNGVVPATTITVSLANVTDGASFQTALRSALVSVPNVVGEVAADGKVTIRTTATGENNTVQVTNFARVDGDGTTTSVLGLNSTGNTASGTSLTSASTNFNYAAGDIAGSNDTLTFKFTYKGVAYTTATHTFGSAAPTDGTAYAAILEGMITNATADTDGITAFGSGKISVDAASAAITISTDGTGSAERFQITQVTAVKNGSGGHDPSVSGGLSAMGAEAQGTNLAAAVYNTTAPLTFASFRAGDTISFDATLNESGGGGVNKTISVKTTAGMTEATFINAVNAALADATNGFGANKVTAGLASGAGSNVVFTTNAQGSTTTFTMSNVRAVDGNGVQTSQLGLSNMGAAAEGADATPAAAGFASIALPDASSLTGSGEVSFMVSVDGGTAKRVTVDRATIDGVLGTAANGAIADEAAWARVVNKALENAGITGVAAQANAGNTAVLLEKTGGVTTGSVAVSGLTSGAGANTVAVGDIDLTSDRFTSLTSDQQLQVINAYISVVRSALTEVTGAAANLGSVASRIESQQSFVDTLMDTIDKGISGLVDADMNEESTRLQALQVKQQLGVQALSIANQSAQNVLSLFR